MDEPHGQFLMSRWRHPPAPLEGFSSLIIQEVSLSERRDKDVNTDITMTAWNLWTLSRSALQGLTANNARDSEAEKSHGVNNQSKRRKEHCRAVRRLLVLA